MFLFNLCHQVGRTLYQREEHKWQSVEELLVWHMASSPSFEPSHPVRNVMEQTHTLNLIGSYIASPPNEWQGREGVMGCSDWRSTESSLWSEQNEMQWVTLLHRSLTQPSCSRISRYHIHELGYLTSSVDLSPPNSILPITLNFSFLPSFVSSFLEWRHDFHGVFPSQGFVSTNQRSEFPISVPCDIPLHLLEPWEFTQRREC